MMRSRCSVAFLSWAGLLERYATGKDKDKGIDVDVDAKIPLP
jgi:hypothetical protein